MIADFQDIKPDKAWSFADSTQSHTRYISHGYHTYPAKFIPQLARRLIVELSAEENIVVDPFMGSGTTIVESLLNQRVGVGVDINPVAYLIAKVKSTPLNPRDTKEIFAIIKSDLEEKLVGKSGLFASNFAAFIPENERIDYWFPSDQKERLGIILGRILNIQDQDIRDFFLVAFSQILKSCSIWLQKSVKPTRDFAKVPTDPFFAFKRQAKMMLKHNEEFWSFVPEKVRYNIPAYRRVECQDARSLPISTGTAALIVTSPPYVTSYEYADLHQLSALWLQYCNSLSEFRKTFIGTAHAERNLIDLKSKTAADICERLGSGQKSREVGNYFADMLECFQEMRRVLKVGGKACVVIGNTKFQGVDILNADVFVEQMENTGFNCHKIIMREIPSKILPQTRDPKSGRFAANSISNKVLAYPVEYILIMEKVD